MSLSYRYRRTQLALLVLVQLTLALPAPAAPRGEGPYVAPAAAARPGLILEYTFEAETGGRVQDTSGNGLHGAKVGFASPSPQPPGPSGGKALEFSGQQLVEVARSDLTRLNSYTLMGWIRYRPNPNEQRIELIEKAHSYWINVRSDTGRARAGSRLGGCSDAAGRYIDSSAAVRPNVWTHVASRYSGSVLTVFINGKPSGQRTVSGTVCVNDQPLAVGAKFATDEVPQQQAFFTGLIDEVRVFNRALSNAEITREMNTHP